MVILGDKGLKLIRLSINGNNFYETLIVWGGAMAPPGPPTKSAPAIYGLVFQNFALVMGLIFEIFPLLWELAMNSQRHIYTRPPTGVTPPPVGFITLTFIKSVGFITIFGVHKIWCPEYDNSSRLKGASENGCVPFKMMNSISKDLQTEH